MLRDEPQSKISLLDSNADPVALNKNLMKNKLPSESQTAHLSAEPVYANQSETSFALLLPVSGLNVENSFGLACSLKLHSPWV